MNSDKTQEDCRIEWEAAKREFLKRIESIDDATPAIPSTEPNWWVEMMDVHRSLLKV